MSFGISPGQTSFCRQVKARHKERGQTQSLLEESSSRALSSCAVHLFAMKAPPPSRPTDFSGAQVPTPNPLTSVPRSMATLPSRTAVGAQGKEAAWLRRGSVLIVRHTAPRWGKRSAQRSSCSTDSIKFRQFQYLLLLSRCSFSIMEEA